MTAGAIAMHAAESSWVVFLQAQIANGSGPIMIQGIRGRDLADRLAEIARDNASNVNLIGLVSSETPIEDAYTLANEFSAFQIHDWWFESSADLVAYIGREAQDALSIFLTQVHPGALSDAPVDIDEIAEIIGVSVPTVRRMIAAKKIPFLKFGRIYRFVPNDVIASLRSQ